MGTKITVRQKAISGERQSLYLDIYPPILNKENGKLTRRDFLGLYIYDKPKNVSEKQYNKEQILIAEQIRMKRENELNKSEVYSDFEKELLQKTEQKERDFLKYFKELTDKRSSSNHDNWVSAYRYLTTFSKGQLKCGDLNVKFCNDFKEFLLNTKSNKSDKTKLHVNSAMSYFNKFKAALRQAFEDGYLSTNLNGLVTTIKQEETRRQFLTLEELNSLAQTECQNPLLKSAALFSALTGLRFSDIAKLTWGEIEFIREDGYYIHFKQKKTKKNEDLPIPEQAISLLGERRNATDKVFEDLKYSAYSNKHLYQWIGASGITKDITFHCFRHTYACLQLGAGTDIYTVSKMLGHKDLKTTQIYANVINPTKRAAADRIKLNL